MIKLNPQDEFLGTVINPVPSLSAGLRIYQLNRQAMASRALAVTFPVTQLLLGSGFDSAVQRYILNHPPQTADWALAGLQFPYWLEQQTELGSVAYVSAMAQLEWHIFNLQRAADPQIDTASFGLLEHYSADALSVAVHPLSVGMQTGFPLQQIWLYHQQPADPALLPAIRHALKTPDYVEYILLTRRTFKAEIILLTADQQALLDLCRAGHSLSELLAALALRELDFGEWLTQMLTLGAVTGFSLRRTSVGTDFS